MNSSDLKQNTIKYYEQLMQNDIIEQESTKILYVLSHHILEWKEHSTCSICLDVYEKPMRTSCFHIFCEKCIKKHFELNGETSGESTYCPICFKPLPQDSLTSLNFLNDYMSYISSAQEELQSLLGTDNLSGDVTEIEAKVRKDLNVRELCFKIPPMFSSHKINEILKPLFSVAGKSLPSTFSFEETNKQTSSNLFDAIKAAPPVNPLFNKRISKTYSKGAKVNKEHKHDDIETYTSTDKVREFENESNKIAIVQWLNDSQNVFNNKLLTQQRDLQESNPDLDMPSASQVQWCYPRKNTRQSSLKQQQKLEPGSSSSNNNIFQKFTQRDCFTKNVNSSSAERRARSLEYKIEAVKRKPRLKRHSETLCQTATEEIVIEQINSEELTKDSHNTEQTENVLSHTKSKTKKQQCVKRLSNSDHVASTSVSCIAKHTRSASKSLGSIQGVSENKSNLSALSGWNRIKDINKTIKKVERKPKKLNVLIEVPRNVTADNNQDVSCTTKFNLRKPKKGNRKRRKITKKSDDNNTTKTIPANNCTSYNLETVETFFNKALVDVSKENEVKPNTSAASPEAPKGVNDNKIEKQYKAEQEEDVNQTAKGLVESVLPKLPNTYKNQKSKARRSLLFSEEKENEMMFPPSVAKSERVFEPNNICLSTELVQNPVKVYKKVTEVFTESNQNIINKPSESPRNSPLKKNDFILLSDDDDEIFKKATQILTQEAMLNENSNNCNDLQDKPVQIIEENLQKVTIQQKVKALGDILNNCSVTNEDFANRINIILKEIQQILGIQPDSCKEMLDVSIQQFQPSVKDVQVQTETNTDANACILDDSLNNQHKHVGIQTNSEESLGGFRISSTEVFNTFPLLTSIQTQTESFFCPECKKVPEKPNAVKLSLEKYMFSESLDNIDFETQEIIKGRQIKKIPLNVVQSDSNLNIRKINNKGALGTIMDKPIKSQMNLHTSSVPKKVSNDKSYKRIRKVSSSSDSDSDILPKSIKRNKYVQENLSVHFISQASTTSGKGKNLGKKFTLSEDSQGIDYEEYLHNVIKGCDEDNVVKRMSPLEPPLAKRSKTQDMIKECKLIIQEACTNAIEFENTEGFNYENQEKGIAKPSLDALKAEFSKTFTGTNQQLNDASHIEVKNTFGNRFSESLFISSNNVSTDDKNNDKKLKIEPVNESKQLTKLNLDQLIDHFNSHSDPLEDAEVESINQSFTNDDSNNRPNKGNIKILQDIIIVNKTSRQVKNNTSCLDLVDNGSDSDSDVVDTTPQKSDERWSFSQQIYYDSKLQVLPPPPGESQPLTSLRSSSCLNKTLPPPIEFQDINEKDEIIVVDDIPSLNVPRLESLTPDLLLSQNNRLPLDNKIALVTSTPSTHNLKPISLLNLSPITGEKPKKASHPIQAAYKSKYSPLTTKYMQPKEDVVIVPQKSENLPQKNKKPCIACTRMTKEQISVIMSLSSKKMITYSNIFADSVSHMIVAVDDNERVKDHTMKFVMAVAAGVWVVSFKWIEECVRQNKIVPEAPFEALDVTGIDGPKQSRLNRIRNPLLKNYKIHVAPPFVSTTQKDVESVIIYLGGEVVSKPHELLKNKGKVCLIITESRGSQNYDLYETWLETLKIVTVDLEWLSRSVGQYKVLSLRPFTLCSENSIYSLGYPSELLIEMSFSSSQNTFGAV